MPSSHHDHPDLFDNRPKRPRVTAEEITRVHNHLHGRRWVNRAKLTAELGIDQRRLREIVSQSQGDIISGQLGYCLLPEASAEEIRTVLQQWESQARTQLATCRKIRAKAHHLIN